MSTAPFFTLPSAWRPREPTPTPSPEVRAEVPFGDLAASLDALAADAGTRPPVALLAAHLKVLDLLTEEPLVRTEVGQGRAPRAGDLCTQPGLWATWREGVSRIGHAVADLPACTDSGATEAHRRERVLFAPDDAAAAPAVQRFETGPYGLLVLAGTDRLVLRARGGGLPADRLQRLAAMYREVLQEMAARPDGEARAACLPQAELDRVLTDWGTGATAHRPPRTVVDLFEEQAARTPHAPAVRVAGTVLTYRELDRRSLQIAHHLLRRGAEPATPVGVCLRRSADLLPALLGVWRASAPYLPLDLSLPPQRLRRMVTASGCELVIAQAEHAQLLREGQAPDLVLLDEHAAAVDAAPATPTGTRPRPADPAYVIYTSGSTGTPKGVLVHHGGLANYLLWTVEEYAARGTGGSPFFTSISFDLQVPSLYAPLLSGQCVNLLPDPLPTADLGALLVAGAPYSFVKLTPGHLNLLSLDLDAEQARDLAGLVIAAGDSFPTALARRWQELAGPQGTAVATEYGPTEITVGNSGQVIGAPDGEGLVPLGAPIPNTTMYVLDERLEPVPEGVAGEVCIGGAGVAHGYLGDAALTAERFVPDPWGSPGSRLYRTGDRARWNAGRLEFLGRTDHQLKIRGHRVEIGEVRETLRRHPDISEAVVVPHERPPGPARLAAFVVPAPDRPLDVPRLRADLAGELPEYMIPSVIVAIDDVPLTANGKVDARLLTGMV
ncbi:amino acid adenylation domain-containing protein [Streptomyces sp. NBC_00564]|uniref:amino acid adenylation domain-containing protein n=1 Tax=Streptomyces sp. NBC_00564 TaxID=2903663 RepID=UPI00352FCA70|nr:amino acid adenylation domain-containing protein [Streptomyces sp. NBC_00564]